MKDKVSRALLILWRLEEQKQYDCPEISEVINILQQPKVEEKTEQFDYSYDDLAQDIVVLQRTWLDWFNGRHLTSEGLTRLNKAVDNLDKFKKVVPNEIGVI